MTKTAIAAVVDAAEPAEVVGPIMYTLDQLENLIKTGSVVIGYGIGTAYESDKNDALEVLREIYNINIIE